MEGLEVSEVCLTEVLESAETFRLDGDYYAKDYLSVAKLIKSRIDEFTKFDSLGLDVDGSAFYPALEPYYGNGTYPFIRVGDVKQYVDFEGCVKIPQSILPDFPTLKSVKKGDIVLTKGGTIANAGLITQDACVSRDLIYINSSILPEHEYTALYLYFSSAFAYKQLVRSSSQSVQPHLTITLVRNLDIFLFSDAFKLRVTEVYREASITKDRSKSLYQESEALLLTELGINSWQPTNKTIEIKSFADSFGISERLDSEFYQPKFSELEDKLRATNQNATLGSLLTFCQRGTQPIYVEEEGTTVLNSKHIRENRIEFTNNRVAKLEDTRPDLVIRKGDVLVNGTGVGTIGRAAAYLSDEEAIPDNHVTILRSNSIDPVFLALQLNSIVGKLQVEKYFKGSSGQIELYPDDIKQFMIWQAPDEVQTKIRVAIESAQEESGKGRKLLDIAKRAVELAIETSEEEAITWLNEQT